MKSFITVVILFALLIALIIANSIFVRSVFSKISNISTSIIENEHQLNQVDRILSLWSKSQDLLILSIEADEIERMNDLMESLYSACLCDNEEDIKKYCRLIKSLSDELIEYEKISFHSIF